jgi:hypothetical protein
MDGKRPENCVKSNVNHRIDDVDIKLGFDAGSIHFDHLFLRIDREGLYLFVKDEGPEMLLQIMGYVKDLVSVDWDYVRASKKVSYELVLDPDLFLALKDRIENCKGPLEILDLEYDGFRFLRDLSNYRLQMYEADKRMFKFKLKPFLHK